MVAEPVAHSRLTDNVDFHAQKLLQIDYQAAVVKERPVGFETDDQIHIGVCCRVTSGDGAEDSNVRLP